MAGVTRDKSLTALVEKAGTDGAKFHANDIALLAQGNIKKVGNKQDNLNIAQNAQNERQVKARN